MENNNPDADLEYLVNGGLPWVLNRHVNKYAEGVYIGRPSKWGNPFIIGRDGNRAQVIHKYSEWICEQPHLMGSLDELCGKNLICWCAPQACHGSVLVNLANSLKEIKFLKET